MSDSKPFVVEFGSKVFLPTLVLATGISFLILYFFNAVFQETDVVERAVAEKSAQAVLTTMRENLMSAAAEHLRRTDAYEATGGEGRDGWLTRNLGSISGTSGYDSVFVIDRSGKTVFAAVQSDPQNAHRHTLASYLGANASEILDKLDTSGKPDDIVSGFLPSQPIISVAAAGNLLPADGRLPAGAPAPLRLVFAKQISTALLARLGQASPLHDIHLLPPDQTNTVVSFTTPDGAVIAGLAWNRPATGSYLRSKFGPIIWGVQILFLLVVGFLVYFSWRGFAQAHESREEAISASLRDELTGLANRRHLMAALSQTLDVARKTGSELSVVYADLDGFKEVNDAYGHEIGDQLLRAVAAGFAFLASKADVVARLGGDEFAIILSGPGARAGARKLANDMNAFLAEPMSFGGRIASVSVSAGIVDNEPGINEIEEILRRADIAMYTAKSNGRDQVQIYDASLDHHRDEARAIARELSQAIEERTLGVMYQPIVDAASRTIKGAEALVRWPKDSRRSFGPDVFIPVAEKFGLIEDLGLQVLGTACRQAAQWPDLFISVNVSPVQFMNPNFADLVGRTLHRSGLPAARLELEVTEGFVIDNADRAMAIIEALHRMGVKVSLDDFGTGYSSIGHLKRFRFDKLKLDRSMVVDVLRIPSALRLVQGTVAMADALGLQVTAEGIEEENQVPVLRLAGCNLFQGYLFSKPVTADQLSALIAQQAPAANAVA